MADANTSPAGSTGAADSPTPMTDADITPPPATTALEPAAPLKDAGIGFDAAADLGADAMAGDTMGAGSRNDTTGADPLAADPDMDGKGLTSATDQVAAGTSGTDPRLGTADMVRDNAQKLKDQAGDKVRAFAEQGRDKATGLLDQLIQTLNDTAATVDDKVGPQYGQYARSAAESVSGIADQIKAKDVDELIAQARALAARSPAVTAGAAAAIGFVLSRLVSAGVENRDPQA